MIKVIKKKTELTALNRIFTEISELKHYGIWSKQLNDEYNHKINDLRLKLRQESEKFNENNLDKYKKTVLGLLLDASFNTYNISKNIIRSKISIKQIKIGRNFVCILSNDCDIYTIGSNTFGQLGIGNTSTSTNFQLIDLPKCNYISCGYSYIIAKTINNEIYSWGAGANGRLGHGNMDNLYIPTKICYDFKEIKNFYAGSVHTVLLTIDGKMYSWGSKYYTGHHKKNDVLLPLEINNLSDMFIKYTNIGFGGYHTVAITRNNYVYAWGHNVVGQLGISINKNQMKNDIDKGLTIIPFPTIVKSDINNEIIQVSCGWGHTIILCQNGSVWSCGRNYRGQLGIDISKCPKNETTSYMDTLTEILFFRNEKIIYVFTGAEHSGAINDNGDIYLWGDNYHNNIPTLNTKFTINPTKINISKPSIIECSGCGTFFLH